MSFLIAIGWIVPPLLIFWRWQREPRWLAYIRYIVAVVFVWFVMMAVVSEQSMIRVHNETARGDIDGSIGDTGANAATALFGWIPGFIYSLLLAGVRQLWLLFRRKRGKNAVA